MPADRRDSLTRSRASTGIVLDGLAWVGLAVAVLVIAWPLGLTNRILSGIDALTYFLPYWAQRMAELRSGHLPLWNPYLFLGVPFLANPQAAVLYPLHWPLTWLNPAVALVWSALLHTWLAAGFTYIWARCSLRLGRPAAWLAGLTFGLGGFTLARIENINQLNTLAWLPLALWLLDATAAASGWRKRLWWGIMLTCAIALQILAGHTQTLFINGVGLVIYAIAGGLIARSAGEDDTAGHAGTFRRSVADGLRVCAPRLVILAATGLAGLVLCAAQLLPTLELNRLGLRTGGLPYRQAVSFSLRPALLAQSLLPPYAGKLDVAFGVEGYAEFVGYVSVVGLVLGGLALVRRRRQDHRVLVISLSLIGCGLLLALGAYNPFYWLLWKLVPGFALFRAPARWLALFALGAAALAGLGLDSLARPDELRPTPGVRYGSRVRWLTRVVISAGLACVALLQHWPALLTVCGWLGVILVTVGGWCARGRWSRSVQAILIGLTLAELWLGSRALPFTHAAAPASLGMRNAPASLLASTADQPAAGRPRFLSLSDIRYDPGDLAELRALQAGRLPDDAIERGVRIAKQIEVLSPNLSMLYRLPAVDGYDGGLLPLARYGQLQALLMPADQISPDGRLREQLRATPEDRLLDLLGVGYVITDKQHDLWTQDVYYDLETPVTLQPGQSWQIVLAGYPDFSATEVGVVAAFTPTLQAVSDGPAELDVADLTVQSYTGAPFKVELPLPAAPPTATTAVRLTFPQPTIPATLTVVVRPDVRAGVVLRGLSLIDKRTGSHTSVTLSPDDSLRRVHSGDVKLYARQGAPGRAWLVHTVESVADDTAALARLAQPTFVPRTSAIVLGTAPEQDRQVLQEPGGGSRDRVLVLKYEAEEIELQVSTQAAGMLVVADSYYSGWYATVDGVATPVLVANLAFRGVAITPGTHRVKMTYQPQSWRWGALISGAALIVLIGAAGVAAWHRPARTL